MFALQNLIMDSSLNTILLDADKSILSPLCVKHAWKTINSCKSQSAIFHSIKSSSVV